MRVLPTGEGSSPSIGHNMITWLLPTRPRGIGQGLAFEVNKEAKEVLRGGKEEEEEGGGAV